MIALLKGISTVATLLDTVFRIVSAPVYSVKIGAAVGQGLQCWGCAGASATTAGSGSTCSCDGHCLGRHRAVLDNQRD